jgi:simple sugar transport system permease protein
MAVGSESPAPAAQPPEPAPPQRPGNTLLDVGRRLLTLREGSIIVVTVIALIYFGTSTSQFFHSDSLKSLLPYFAPYAILAAGEVFVMINGEIDLSIGATWLFTPFVFFKFTDLGLPLVPALILALVVATAIGLINGFFVAYIGLASFVATLGMLFVLDGLSLIISHATQVSPFPGTSVTGSTGTFASVFGGGTYSELFWALGIVIVLQIALSFSRWGLYTVAVGGNRHGASEAGIKVNWNLIRNFAVCALLAGFAGILEAIRAKTATPDPAASNDFLLLSIAAAVAGGTLLQGGAGTVVGALIGAVFLGILQEGLNLKGVSANYRDLYLGLALLIAMTANTFIGRVRLGSGHG